MVVNNALSVQLIGLDPVLQKLRRLPPEMETRILKNALRKGAKVVQAAAKANVRQHDDPATPEKIWKNVATIFSTRKSRRGELIVMSVGVRGGARPYSNTPENRRKGRVGKLYKTLGDKGSVFGGNPGGDTWYWRFLEFGVPAHGISAKYPMTRALRDNVSRVIDVVTVDASQGLDRMFPFKVGG